MTMIANPLRKNLARINSAKTFFKCFIYLWIIIITSCSKEENLINNNTLVNDQFIRSMDLSSFPQIEATNPIFYNQNGEEDDLLNILKQNGVNTIRLRLWHNPESVHSSFNEVKIFSDRLKTLGMKIWIATHYSNTWADPGNQVPPLSWQGISFSDLKDSVYNYTKRITLEIQPEFIQIGNEINSGFLFPYGEIISNEDQFRELIAVGIQAVKENSITSKIVIHFAGTDGADWFFNKLIGIDYDVIGISYYPIWHGKDLDLVQSTLASLSAEFDKNVIVAETAYPFTLNWNDWTNNIVGLEEQLILPEFPATPTGQKEFLFQIKEIVKSVNKGIGFCYWGGELIAFNGPQSTNGSVWENQALFDFNNKVLPAIEVFNKE